jgi:hypothetical protein
MSRLLTLIVFALTPLAIRAADEENPFKTARVGAYARYDHTLTTNSLNKKITQIQTVTAVDEKEVTLRTTSVVDGKELPIDKPDQKIDLTKPFTGVTAKDAPPNSSFKWEKAKDGKEKVKVGGKEYDCTWTTYKPVVTRPGSQVAGELKVWMSKDVPFVVRRTLKLQLNASVELAYETQLTELGSKK